MYLPRGGGGSGRWATLALYASTIANASSRLSASPMRCWKFRMWPVRQLDHGKSGGHGIPICAPLLHRSSGDQLCLPARNLRARRGRKLVSKLVYVQLTSCGSKSEAGYRNPSRHPYARSRSRSASSFAKATPAASAAAAETFAGAPTGEMIWLFGRLDSGFMSFSLYVYGIDPCHADCLNARSTAVRLSNDALAATMYVRQEKTMPA